VINEGITGSPHSSKRSNNIVEQITTGKLMTVPIANINGWSEVAQTLLNKVHPFKSPTLLGKELRRGIEFNIKTTFDVPYQATRQKS
jgi:hypothetical protein